MTRPGLANDQGASLALVALSLVWMVGLVAFVVDLGDGWLTRQSLIPATDAAALAAAQDLVARPGDATAACAMAQEYVVANAGTATMTDCQVTNHGGGGHVTVLASDQLDPSFADPSSVPDNIVAASTVQWGPPLTVSGLHPFGLCYDGSAGLKQLIDNPPTSRTFVRVTYTKDDPALCGGTAALGNFATIDFETATPIYEIRQWMLNGYPDHLGFDPATVTDCSGTAVCFDRPYASSDIRDEVNALTNAGTYISFPIFNYADTDYVHLIGVLRAKFYQVQLDGTPEEWWVELKVEPGLVAGTCCGPPALRTGTKTIAICGVDDGSGSSAVGGCSPSGGP